MSGFKLETHMHTSEGSACGHVSAQDQVRQYKRYGYDGILVTDHFINGNSAVDRTLPWGEQMQMQFSGFDNALREGRKIGLRVFCGIEYAYKGTEFILIGPDVRWFTGHPEVKDMKPPEFLRLFREEGFAVIQAHPYREADYIKKIRLYPDECDALEVFNLANKDEYNKKAEHLALQYGKPGTAGSDCHYPDRLGAGIVLDHEPYDVYELRDIIKSGKGYEPFKDIRELL